MLKRSGNLFLRNPGVGIQTLSLGPQFFLNGLLDWFFGDPCHDFGIPRTQPRQTLGAEARIPRGHVDVSGLLPVSGWQRFVVSCHWPVTSYQRFDRFQSVDAFQQFDGVQRFDGLRGFNGLWFSRLRSVAHVRGLGEFHHFHTVVRSRVLRIRTTVDWRLGTGNW